MKDKLIKELNLKLYCHSHNYYMENDDIVVCLIIPHRGSEFKYIVRADYKKNFDKWINVPYELYLQEDSDIEIAIKQIKNMIKYKNKILIEEYDPYNERYYHDINEEEFERLI